MKSRYYERFQSVTSLCGVADGKDKMSVIITVTGLGYIRYISTDGNNISIGSIFSSVGQLGRDDCAWHPIVNCSYIFVVHMFVKKKNNVALASLDFFSIRWLHVK